MNNAFAQALQREFNACNNLTFTENGAVAHKSTGSALLNFFSQAGALRLGRGAENASDLFFNSLGEDKLRTVKGMFYFRDVRGGQGERETFRVFLKQLAHAEPEILRKNLDKIPEFGRWDDMYALIDTDIMPAAFEIMKAQFIADLQSDKPSLLGKWLKSENTSSPASRALGAKTRVAFGLTPKQYRKGLTVLRHRINVLERLLSTNKWSEVDYSHVPSQANLKYRKAFARHDLARFTEFHQKVANGEAKINANTQFPYEIVAQVWDQMNRSSKEQRMLLDNMWNSQPDYIGKAENSIVVADTSGSMMGLPIQVSISLAIYAAERNTGPFHNKFITFSNSPELQSVSGSDICEKVQRLSRARWDMNTNVKAVFDVLLSTAVKNKMSNDEMVKKVFIVSDMEFDHAAGHPQQTLFDSIAQQWKREGYDLPLLVFWNVASRNEQFPMSLDDRGFMNVSGCSPSIFTNLMKGEFKGAYEMMLDVLDGPRYANIVI